MDIRVFLNILPRFIEFLVWHIISGDFQNYISFREKKLKVTLVQALRLCTVRTAHRGSRGIALLFHDHDTRKGSASNPGRSLLPGETRYPLYKKAGWAPGPVCTGAENQSPTGIRSPDHPARRQSLYRLSYPSPRNLGSYMVLHKCTTVFM